MKHPFNNISVAELKQKLNSGQAVNLIDVREPLEYHTHNIGGENLPLSSFSEKIAGLNYNKDAEIIVICQRGIRSETARQLMVAAGFTGVRNLTGGLIAYRRITE